MESRWQLNSWVDREGRHWLPTVAGRACAVAAALAVLAMITTGCRPAAPRDDAPLDLRGDPILPSANVSGTASGSPASSTWAPALDAESFSDDALGLVGFDRLAGYDYEGTAAALAAKGRAGGSAIPAGIRALHGTEVAIKGFMLPLRVDGGRVTELLLMRDQSMCCFGIVPNLNDWVSVQMPQPGVKAIMDQPVIIFGKLEVGEVYDHGILSSIYRMKGEELLDALDL